MHKIIIKPLYTTAELSQVLSFNSQRTRRLLLRLNVPHTDSGNQMLWHLSGLATYAPELYNSIIIMSALQERALDLDE